MLDHLMRRPTDVKLGNGVIIRLLPLSPKALAMIGAEEDPARKSVMTVQLCVCGDDDRLRWGPEDIDKLTDDLDAGYVKAIDAAITTMFFEAGEPPQDPLSDRLSPTPDVGE